MVKDVCTFPGDGQNRPLPLLLPDHVQLEDDLFAVVFILWPISHLEKMQKFFLWRSLPHASFLCLFMLLSVLNFLPQHMATVLLNLVLDKRWQTFESLVKDIREVNPLSLYCALYFCTPPAPSSSLTSGMVSSSPVLLPSSISSNSPTNLPLTPVGLVASR